MFDSHDARYTDTCGQFRHHGNRDGAEPGGFDLTLNQSHGPAADGSDRNQDHGIHVFLAKLADDERHRLS
jgi:hypothetical protein